MRIYKEKMAEEVEAKNKRLKEAKSG